MNRLVLFFFISVFFHFHSKTAKDSIKPSFLKNRVKNKILMQSKCGKKSFFSNFKEKATKTQKSLKDFRFFTWVKNKIRDSSDNAIKRKHIQLKKRCKGKIYFIKNSFGSFSVCIQNHLKYEGFGLASFYNEGEVYMANAKKFNPMYYTAAHAFLPLNCVVEVTSLRNKKQKLIVKITDRGPLSHNTDVIIDLTYKGAEVLGFIKQGFLPVKIRILQKETKLLKENGGPLIWTGEESFEEVYNRYKKLNK